MSETFDERISAAVKKALSDPTLYPDELKAWLPRYLEINPPATQLGDIQGLYTMSSSISGLGVKINGRIGMIRSGSTPYEYLRMTYDSVLGKWLSDAQMAADTSVQASTTSASFVIIPQGSTAGTNLVIVNALDLYNSGLRPQISWSLWGQNVTVGPTIAVRPSIYEFNTGTSPYAGTLAAHTTGDSRTSDGAAYAATQAWEDVTWDATPSKSNWLFSWEAKTSSGTLLVNSSSSFRLRWVG